MQIIREAILREADDESRDDRISFSIPCGPYKIICIVHVPPQGETKSIAYIKWVLNKRVKQHG